MLITDPLPRSFTSRFGILVPNTNYPPRLDYRYSSWMAMTLMGEIDVRMIFINCHSLSNFMLLTMIIPRTQRLPLLSGLGW